MDFTSDGRMLPKIMVWTDGHVYEIQKVTDVRLAASLKPGGVGQRYTCKIDGKGSRLFYEDNNLWFVERKQMVKVDFLCSMSI